MENIFKANKLLLRKNAVIKLKKKTQKTCIETIKNFLILLKLQKFKLSHYVCNEELALLLSMRYIQARLTGLVVLYWKHGVYTHFLVLLCVLAYVYGLLPGNAATSTVSKPDMNKTFSFKSSNSSSSKNETKTSPPTHINCWKPSFGKK